MDKRLPLDWYPVTTLPVAATTADIALTARPCRLFGFTAIETTGAAAAVFQLLDGGDANGAPVVEVSLTAGQSIREWFGQPGIKVQSGLFLNMISGSIRAAIWPLLLTEAEIVTLAGFEL